MIVNMRKYLTASRAGIFTVLAVVIGLAHLMAAPPSNAQDGDDVIITPDIVNEILAGIEVQSEIDRYTALYDDIMNMQVNLDEFSGIIESLQTTANLLMDMAGGGGGLCILCPLDTRPSNVRSEHSRSRQEMMDQFGVTTLHTALEFQIQQLFMDYVVFRTFIKPALQMMTEQFSAAAMHQAVAIGMFFDAEQVMATNRLYQRLTAQAHKDYQPSTGMCVFGTNVRALMSAERNAEYTAFVMGQRSIDRQMGNMNSAAAPGQFADFAARLENFRSLYCDYHSYGGGLDPVCNFDTDDDGSQDLETPDTANRDIAYSRIVDRNTLAIDLSDTDITPDERDIFSLASNLYSHNTAIRVPEIAFRKPANRDAILDLRAVVAKRSVAEHSFNTMVGLRSPSSEFTGPDAAQYMRLILDNLGVSDNSAMAAYLGDQPSYYAQMEVLTKRIFQDGQFYTNLYDKPANVDRKGVALQAIGLMQSFDTWQSYLRTEAMLSVLLELEIMKLQDEVQNRLNTLDS